MINVPAPVPREDFQKWLVEGGRPLQINRRDNATTLITLPKAEGIDYLFSHTGRDSPGIHWNEPFRFCGLYSREDQSLHLIDSGLRWLVDGLTNEECMDADSIRKKFCELVNRRVEERIANDRNRLAIKELSDERLQKRLADYREYEAGDESIRLFFDGKEPDIQFYSSYKLDSWQEETLVAYIQNPDTIIALEAENYISSHQQELLAQFLENDALLVKYQALVQDSGSPIHRMKAITDAIQGCGAKSVNVTVQKGEMELTFKAAADSLTGHRNSYSIYYISAPDRRNFEAMFGRHSNYNAEEITKITYGKNTIYEALPVQTEDVAEEMGGMHFG